MQTLKLRIPLTPRAKTSVRLGQKGHWYNPRAREMGVLCEYVKSELQKHPNFRLMKGPILAIVHYRIPASPRIAQWKRAAQHYHPHIARPDGDNLEKFLNDSLNGVLWDDDSKIAWLFRSKSRTKAKVGETILFVRECPDGPPNYDQIFQDLKDHVVIEDD